MNRSAMFLWALWLLLPGTVVRGADATEVRLVLEAGSVQRGETLWAGIHFRLADGWHTYWRNGGDAAKPATIVWDLPEGIRAGEIHWPVPEKYEAEGLHSYIYKREVVLLVPLSVDVVPGTHTLAARVDWLECADLCLPGEASVEAVLRVGERSEPSPDAALIGEWRTRLPGEDPALTLESWWEGEEEADARSLGIGIGTGSTLSLEDFYPHVHSGFTVEGPTTATEDGIVKTVTREEGDWPASIRGLARVREAGEERARFLEVTLEPGNRKPSGGWGRSLQMLLYAFVGGFILNFMPCVLPVISLKILGFVRQKESPGAVRRMGWLYALGVICSFLLLALLLIVVQQTGRLASWGMQFQSLPFVVFMMLLVLLVALNFFGVYEIVPPGRLTGFLGRFAGGSGDWGAFSNGVLATVLATPCTAPFLAVSLGFAFSQPPLMILLIFLTIALGLALPYVVLASDPRLLSWLPRPGPWMARFRTVMGFPMAATALWLYTVALDHFPEVAEAALWLGLMMVLVALAVWIWGEFVQKVRVRRALGMALSLLVGIGGFLWTMEAELHWRTPDRGIRWVDWSPEEVARAREEGRPVLVDFTATWCVTCKVNKRIFEKNPVVRERLSALDVSTLRADFTQSDPAIAAELRRHGRAGVPMVLVFQPDPATAPRVLPVILTPQIVLEALDWAEGEA